MIHHIISLTIRLVLYCCIGCAAAGSEIAAEREAEYRAARASVPNVILNVTHDGMRESMVLLYCFVRVFHRMPGPKEIWRRRKLGEWVVKVRALEAAAPGGLIANQRLALDAIPLWRSTEPPKAAPAPAPAAASARASVRAPAPVPSAPPKSRQQQQKQQVDEDRQPLLSLDEEGMGAPPPYQQ